MVGRVVLVGCVVIVDGGVALWLDNFVSGVTLRDGSVVDVA